MFEVRTIHDSRVVGQEYDVMVLIEWVHAWMEDGDGDGDGDGDRDGDRDVSRELELDYGDPQLQGDCHDSDDAADDSRHCVAPMSL